MSLNNADFFEINTSNFNDKIFVQDFNADGKSDILTINSVSKAYNLYSIRLTNTAPFYALTQLSTGTINTNLSIDFIQFGDFNGDKKIDFVVPFDIQSPKWQFYYSTGNSFFLNSAILTVNFLYTSTTSNFYTYNNNYQFKFTDFDKDGKTDMVIYTLQKYRTNTDPNNNNIKSNAIVRFDRNIGENNFVEVNRITLNTDNNITINLIIGEIKNNIKTNSDFILIQDNNIWKYKIQKKVSKEIQLSEIKEIENLKRTKIFYQELDPYNILFNPYPLFYTFSNDETYPYKVLPKMPETYAISAIQVVTALGTLHQDFRYQSLTIQSNGSGYKGFKKVFSTNWYDENSDINTIIWSATEYSPQLMGSPIANWSFKNSLVNQTIKPILNNTDNNYLHLSTTDYSFNTSFSKVKKINPILIRQIDFQTNVTTTTTNQFDDNYNSLIYTKSTNSLGYKSSKYTLDNNYNANDANFYVGRLTQTIDSTAMYGDLYITQDNYTYTNSLLTQSIKKYNNNPQTINTTMMYDVVGNIISSTSTIGNKSRTSSTIYDANKRFAKTKTDIDGKITNFVNNDLGQQISVTNYLNQTVTKTYNSWGKLISSSDNFNENILQTNIVFKRLDNGGLTIQTSNNIGGYSLETYDIASNLIKTKVKGFIENSYIETETKFDVLGKKLKIYEPYFLELSYTEFVRNKTIYTPGIEPEDPGSYEEIPIYNTVVIVAGTPEEQKTFTTINYDNLGRPISQVLPSGKTISISYNGLTTSTNDGVTTSIVNFDANGNKASVTENNKTIYYTYLANNQISTSTIDGHTLNNTYDDWGRKSSQADPSIDNNLPYRYVYNEWGELIAEYTPNNDSTKIFYDNNGKITQKISKGLNTDQIINYTYDANLFLTQESGILNSQTFNKTFSYDSRYRLINTTETAPYLITSNTLTYDDYGRLNTKNINSYLKFVSMYNNGNITIKYNYNS